MPFPEKIGVVISTYNKPHELELVLNGYRDQSDLDFAIYIADDGSDVHTKIMIDRIRKSFPTPVAHIWQEDRGFRLARIRNRALAQALTDGCDYVIITDGDCIPLPDLIASHRRWATEGCFLNGERLLLSEKLTHELLAHPWPIHQESRLSLLGRAKKREINRMLPLLMPVHAGPATRKLRGLRGCHMSFWSKDLEYVNGFDEAFEGWGREDSDLAARLFHAGIRRRNLRGIPLLHLWHPEAPRAHLSKNDELLQETIRTRRVRARKGLAEAMGGD
ncbi:MAG: glycosyltransferase [Zetaproteobacteria bacterium]|nr:MAG: glycosyltransferase [Zetaproteobacteria bacterium]